MKKASISEAKNALSALLDRVRRGQTVIIEDRGVPVARLEPITLADDPEGRIARLQRQGAVRGPLATLPPGWTTARPPRLLKGRSTSDLVIEDRARSR